MIGVNRIFNDNIFSARSGMKISCSTGDECLGLGSKVINATVVTSFLGSTPSVLQRLGRPKMFI